MGPRTFDGRDCRRCTETGLSFGDAAWGPPRPSLPAVPGPATPRVAGGGGAEGPASESQGCRSTYRNKTAYWLGEVAFKWRRRSPKNLLTSGSFRRLEELKGCQEFCVWRGAGLPASSSGRSFWLLGCVRPDRSSGAVRRGRRDRTEKASEESRCTEASLRFGRSTARDDSHQGRFKTRRPAPGPTPPKGLDGCGRSEGPAAGTSSKSSTFSAVDFLLDLPMKSEPRVPS
ncbi:uncharacterized protein LOC133229746 isoform X3 [Bos javanicus]|uniref:uncharacterized protein LOC133229746 isoform X3 n=1 Tax=Bos javanicus TaxID=9906 RepID=UPI002AA7F577|nr:uncharacterized protein LOC133229746 isoform X3 [Bos javanicus]